VVLRALISAETSAARTTASSSQTNKLNLVLMKTGATTA